MRFPLSSRQAAPLTPARDFATLALMWALGGCPAGAVLGQDGGTDAATPNNVDAGIAAADAGTTPDSGLTSHDADAGRDSGFPRDAGSSVVDGGTTDAGLLSDAGSSAIDAGLPSDAGSSATDAGPPDAGALVCAPVQAALDVDPWTVRAPGSGFGGIVTGTTGTYSDVFLQSPAADGQVANYIRIGVRLNWGGSIVYFGLPSSASSDVVDAHDTGREVQVALYDQARQWEDCAWNASCTGAAPCGTGNNFLGWDPVQGGDWCTDGSAATWTQSGDSLVVTAQPIQWNPNWDAMTCVSTCPGGPASGSESLTMSLRFVTPWVVEVATESTITDGVDHTLALQEFPCLYPSMGQLGPSMDNLFDATGMAVTLPAANSSGPVATYVTSPQPYVVWQDAANTYGIGLGSDQGMNHFWAIRDDTTPFRYARADAEFALPAAATVRGISYLALGNLATVQGALNGVLASRPPFGHIDLPASGTMQSYAAGGTVEVAGWVLDTAQLTQVIVTIDGAQAAVVPVAASRPDVCGAYPNYDGCPTTAAPSAASQVGFDDMVPTTGLSPCAHLLAVTATDPDGNTTVLGERVIQQQ